MPWQTAVRMEQPPAHARHTICVHPFVNAGHDAEQIGLL